MSALPANLPDVSTARLPASYEHAKTALAECTRIDECQDWADKAEAMASYAKQAGDTQLRKMCDRIQARAIRRCGELLKQVKAAENQHVARARAQEGAPPSRTEAANGAGLSEHQRKTALRVASIPDDDFNQDVESEDPSSVTKLAKKGTQTRPLVDLKGRKPEHFAISTRGQGHLRSFAQFARDTDPDIVAKGAMPDEVPTIRKQIATIDAWLDRLVVSLED